VQSPYRTLTLLQLRFTLPCPKTKPTGLSPGLLWEGGIDPPALGTG